MRDFQRRLGDEIRKQRLAIHMSQDKVGDAVGKSGSYIGRLERCETWPSLPMLLQLIALLSIDVNEIFSGTSSDSPEIAEICFLAKTMDEKKRALLLAQAKVLHSFKLKG